MRLARFTLEDHAYGASPFRKRSKTTVLQSTGASARYHTQDGRHTVEAIVCALLAGVACVPCVS